MSFNIASNVIEFLVTSASYAITASYAENGGAGGGGVTQIVAGTNITISPPGGTGIVTIDASSTTTSASYSTSASVAVSASYTYSASVAVSSSYARSASVAVSASYALSSSYAYSASVAVSASYVLSASYAASSSVAVSASYARSASVAVSSSYVTTASYALTASSADIFVVRTALTASGLNYPTIGGLANQVIETDGNGNLSFDDVHTMLEDVYSGEAITKGDPLYISGSQGAKPIVYKADAAIASKMPVTYIALETVGANTNTRGIILGLIEGINLTGYAAGTEVYIAAGGGWTSTRPTGSAIIQILGYVTKEGSGGKGLVLNPGPANLPNLQTGYVWVGNNSWTPTSTPTSSIKNVISSSYAASSSVAVSASYARSASVAVSAITAQTASYVSGIVNASLLYLGTSGYFTSNQVNAAPGGTTPIASIATGSFRGAFFDYTVDDGATNARAGTIQIIIFNNTVQYNETATMDIGDTSDITWSVVISGPDAVVQATTTLFSWDARYILRSV